MKGVLRFFSIFFLILWVFSLCLLFGSGLITVWLTLSIISAEVSSTNYSVNFEMYLLVIAGIAVMWTSYKVIKWSTINYLKW